MKFKMALIILNPLILFNLFSQSNTPPVIADIPIQVANGVGIFPDLDLNVYLKDSDGDPIQWSYFQTNRLNNGEAPSYNYNYQSPSMTLLGRIKVRGEFPLDANGDILVAYHDGELKGFARAIMVAPQYFLFFLTIDGENPGDEVRFQYFDASQSTIFDVDHSVNFISQLTLGSPVSPYKMDAGFISVLDEGIPNTGMLFPRTFESDWVGVDTFYMVAQEMGTAESYSDTARVIFTSNGYNLPLDLLAFSAENIGDNILLDWKIENAENVLGFEVQHALAQGTSNQFRWQSLEFIPFNNKRTTYDYIHHLPRAGINYYRLKIIDIDNSFAYSPIVSEFQHEIIDLRIFPNPSSGLININIETRQDLVLKITNPLGQVLVSENISGQESHNLSLTYDLSVFEAGLYQVSIFGDGKIESRMVMIGK